MMRLRIKKGGIEAASSARGSVSVFFIAATAAFVLLAGLLIDFARIAAFRKQAELAVQSGVRSVLSSYDPGVYERFGLFIRGGEDAGDLFLRTVEGHFAGGSGYGAFPYLDAGWEDTGVTESRPLGDHSVFRRQVLEDMKYKAPIDLALDPAGRIRGISPALKQAGETVSLLEKMRASYDRREAHLDDSLESQKQGGAQILTQLRNAADVLSSGVDGDGAISADIAVTLADQADRIRSAASEYASRAMEAWRKAREANEEMAAAASPGTRGIEPSIPSDSEDTVDADRIRALAELRDSAKQLVLSQTFFGAYASEIDAQLQSAMRLAAAIDSFSASDRDKLESGLAQYEAAYGETGTVLLDRQAALASHRTADGRRMEEERAARAGWSDWTRLSGIWNGRPGSEEDRSGFQTAQRLAEENLQWNRAKPSDPMPVSEAADAADPSRGRDLALASADGLLQALNDSLSGARDALYFAEYTMDRMSQFPVSKMERLLAGEQIPLPLADQETEYVLYGFADPSRNLASAYGEIFAFRLAVRTLEGLVECRYMGHPLAVLAAALAYGVRNAVLDMRRLVESGSVPLCKYMKTETSYADYLRLFLLLHGGSAEQTSRQIAVIEFRTGIAFSQAYTYASATGVSSLRLWFFPGLLKMFGRTGQLGGSVKGDRYEAEYTADSSYQ